MLITLFAIYQAFCFQAHHYTKVKPYLRLTWICAKYMLKIHELVTSFRGFTVFINVPNNLILTKELIYVVMRWSQNRGKVTESDLTEYQNAHFSKSAYCIVVSHHLQLRVVILRTLFPFHSRNIFSDTFTTFRTVVLLSTGALDICISGCFGIIYVNAWKCDYVEKNGLLSLGTDIYSLSGLGWMADAMWARSWILQIWDDSTV